MQGYAQICLCVLIVIAIINCSLALNSSSSILSLHVQDSYHAVLVPLSYHMEQQ